MTEPGATAPTIYKPTLEGFKLKLLVYGEPGVGKTTLAGSAQDDNRSSPVLFANVEGGMLSVADRNPDAMDLSTVKEAEELFWFLARGKHEYKTVVIDSLSELQLNNLEEIATEAVGKTSKGGKSRTSPDDIWQEDYGVSTIQLRRVIKKMRGLPLHVIYTCLTRHDQDADRNEVVGPALTPKLQNTAMGNVDVVGYLYTSERVEGEGEEQRIIVERKMLCQPVGKWQAKDRSPSGRLGRSLVNPTMTSILDRIVGPARAAGKGK